jgi:RNA recognition motif-containing protein
MAFNAGNGKRVYVGRLPPGIQRAELEDLFKRYAPLTDVRPMGAFAFVEFSSSRVSCARPTFAAQSLTFRMPTTPSLSSTESLTKATSEFTTWATRLTLSLIVQFSKEPRRREPYPDYRGDPYVCRTNYYMEADPY